MFRGETPDRGPAGKKRSRTFAGSEGERGDRTLSKKVWYMKSPRGMLRISGRGGEKKQARELK